MKAGALAAVLLAGLALALPDHGDRAREAATDRLMAIAPRPADEGAPAVVIAIDQQALATAGPWPWSRERLARLIERVAAAGAAAVAVDIVLAGPDAGDAALQRAVASAPTVLATLAGDGWAPGIGVGLLGAVDLSAVPRLQGLEPVPSLGVPAGFAGLPGSTVRAVPLLVGVTRGADITYLPGLATSAIGRALGAETMLVRAGSPMTIEAGLASWPLPSDGTLRLHRARRAVPVLSASSLLDAGLQPGALRGRIAFVGVTAPGAAALRSSTLGAFTPSVILHAESAAQLAAGWVPRRLEGGRILDALAAVVLGLLAAFAVGRKREFGILLALGLAAGWAAVAGLALRFGPILLDPALPIAAILLSGIVELSAQTWHMARERALILARFAQRLPAGMVDRLLALPAGQRLAPRRYQVSIVMTDLAGFAGLVQRADPAALVGTLNAYLAGIEAAIVGQGGTLERLIGDSVLGVFGAPIPQPDHAKRAVTAARDVDRFAETFRRRPDAAALGWGATRIGVTTGEVLAGELGASRLTWSVCGDAANMAARLQELGKVVGQRALVCGIEDPTLPPPLGRFELRGFAEPVEVRPLLRDLQGGAPQDPS